MAAGGVERAEDGGLLILAAGGLERAEGGGVLLFAAGGMVKAESGGTSRSCMRHTCVMQAATILCAYA